MQKRLFVTQQEVEVKSLPVPNHPNFNCKLDMRFGKLLVVGFQGYSEGINPESQYYCKCDCGNYLIRRTGSLNNKLMRSCGCVINQHKRSSLVDMINLANEKTDYEIVEANELFDSIWKFRCAEHGEFSARYSDVVHKGSECRKCSKHGYKTNSPGYLYVNLISQHENGLCLKFGITNLNPEIRAKQLEK